MYLQYLSGTFYTKLGIASRPVLWWHVGLSKEGLRQVLWKLWSLVRWRSGLCLSGWGHGGGYHGITRVSPQAHPRWRWDNDSQVLDVFTVYCTLNLRSSLIFVHFSHPFLGSFVRAKWLIHIPNFHWLLLIPPNHGGRSWLESLMWSPMRNRKTPPGEGAGWTARGRRNEAGCGGAPKIAKLV